VNRASPPAEEQASAVPVAEAAAGDERAGIADAVAGNDELEQRRARVQRAVERRERHVHDEEVQNGQERAEDDDGERAPRGFHQRLRGGAGERHGGCHALSVEAIGARY
jgi:hypothetical protein